MEIMTELNFILCITWILIHELDAIKEREWRFFFVRIPIQEEAAYRIFTALHVPLIIWILWNIDSVSFQYGLSIFLIVHLGLHIGLRNHPKVAFDNWFSWVWIAGGAILGGLQIILLST